MLFGTYFLGLKKTNGSQNNKYLRHIGANIVLQIENLKT